MPSKLVAEPVSRADHAPRFSGLIGTKLYPPRSRPGALPRPALVGRLRSTTASLVVVKAPAGWGKSTLLASWYHSASQPEQFACYSVEAPDNDAGVFWAYVLQTIGQIEPRAIDEAAALHAAVGTTPIDDVIPALLNGLQHCSNGMILVIEDYHVIDNPTIHEALGYFVEHLPPGHRTVITSRTDPPLPLARLRARGQLLELGLGDLRFDVEETRNLLEAETGVALAPRDAARMQEKTEGWAAGLHLAALSLRGREDPGLFIGQFTGDDRLVVDYLLSEVLDRQSDAVRSFLRHSAVLDRFCVPLCRAVTGDADAEAQLDHIERAQLFLVPLDNRRHWYRYHHLFAELLRRELDLIEGPEAAVALHARASAWFEENELIVEAIAHALAAREFHAAARLITTRYLQLVNEGQVDRLLGWFDLLPTEVFNSAELAFVRAMCLINSGEHEGVERWLRLAEMADPVPGPITGRYPTVEAGVASLRGILNYFTGDLGEAERWNRLALTIGPDGNGETFVNSYVLGAACYHRGDYDQALRWLERDRCWSVATGTHVLTLMTDGYIAAIALADGDVIGARRVIQESRALSARHHLDQYWTRARLELVEASMLAREGRALDAVAKLRDALEGAKRGGDRLLQLEVLRLLATLEREHADPLAVHREAEGRRLAATCPDPGPLSDWLARRSSPTGLLPAGLTSRQAGVLRLVAQGLSDAQVAQQLALSERTVHAHLRNIYAKLGVKGRTGATRFAVEHRLL